MRVLTLYLSMFCCSGIWLRYTTARVGGVCHLTVTSRSFQCHCMVLTSGTQWVLYAMRSCCQLSTRAGDFGSTVNNPTLILHNPGSLHTLSVFECFVFRYKFSRSTVMTSVFYALCQFFHLPISSLLDGSLCHSYFLFYWGQWSSG